MIATSFSNVASSVTLAVPLTVRACVVSALVVLIPRRPSFVLTLSVAALSGDALAPPTKNAFSCGVSTLVVVVLLA